jgi:hypothetical protein
VDRDLALLELQRVPEHQRPAVRLQREQAGVHRDINAGTYKELVEAAEACQVAIIHPGKPKNPNEPGLEELLERAKPFMCLRPVAERPDGDPALRPGARA